jgi:alkanesulfonate monooxygenase SsuD/methylene tetrahydromethanopterin reductase-like flavin-dependent oxidoreductase (luciferase family)
MGTVRFGWHIPPFPIDGAPAPGFLEQLSSVIDDTVAAYDSLWMDDHLLPWADFLPADTAYLECMTTVAFLAARYPEVDIGTSMLCQSFRNPGLVAKMGANLQLLTGGRFVLGIGAGWHAREHRAYGYEFPEPRVRIARLAEAVQVIRILWTQRPASYDGHYFQLDHAYCEPRPDPRSPILIGGGGEQLTLRVVARYADWWNLTGGSPERYAHKLSVLRRHCDDVGRDYDEIVKTWSAEVVAIAETEREAKQIADASPYRDPYPVVGTPEQVAEQLHPFVELGVQELILRFVDFSSPRGSMLFADAVMDHLRS